MKTHNTKCSGLGNKAKLKNILEEIKQTQKTEEVLNTLSEILFDVMENTKPRTSQDLQNIQTAFAYLMSDNQYLFFQRKLLSLHSMGNKKVFSKAAKLFNTQLCALVSKNTNQPPTGILILLLILRKSLPNSSITQQIPKWHIEATAHFNAEESLLLYNTMFNQKSFINNVKELQSVLPELDWVEQWKKHGIKKLTTYLYFWQKGSNTNKLKILHQHLKITNDETDTTAFNDFITLLKMALSENGEIVRPDPSLKLHSKLNLFKGAVSNYIAKPLSISNRKPRVAILVSGQLRGYEHTIKNWQKHLLPNIEADFYVHTWKEVGLSGTEPFRRNLPFDGKEFNKAYRIHCNKIGHGAFVKHYPNLFQKTSSYGNVTKDHLSELYQTDHIVIEDSKSPEFDGWSNSRKMHYKISQAQSLLDESGRNYDIVIRIRPDKDIRALLGKWSDIYSLINNTDIILADFPYGVHYGSLMIGDQVAVSSQQTMRKYSATYTDAYELSKINKLSMNSFFSGHRSVARQCLLNGLSVGRFPAQFGGLLTAKNLPTIEIHEMISQDSINRLDETDRALLKALEEDMSASLKRS